MEIAVAGGVGGVLAMVLALDALLVRPAMAQESGPAFLVANINHTVDASAGSWARNFIAAGDLIYFVADDGTHGPELWRSDRTPAGTQLVADLPLPSAPYYADNGPQDLTPFGDALYFTTGDLWRVRGIGAQELIERGPLSAVQRLGAELAFERDGQLWITDGAPGAARWVAPASDGSANRFAIDSRLFALDCRYDLGCSLWSSDGTPAGTGVVRQLGGGPLQFFGSLDLPVEHAAIGDVVYFLAETPEAGVELWRSDGTADGTRMVRDINPGPAAAFPRHYDNYGDHIAYLTRVGDGLLFVASDGTTGFELWRSDGTSAGTRLVADLVPGPEGLFDCVATDQACDDYTAGAALGGVFYVTARRPGDDGEWHEWQLWRSDGSAAGTEVVESGVDPHVVASDGQLYFTRPFDEQRSQLWRRGATDVVSTPVAVLPGYVLGYLSPLTALPGGIAFDLAPADVGWWGNEPWWSDGTEAGSYLLRDIRGDDASSAPRAFVSLGAILLFSADDGLHGRELWRSDASAAGTTLVADIAPGPGGSDPQRPVRLGDLALFVADDGVHGREIWRSDGTAAGTALVADINPSASADPGTLTVAGPFAYFFANDGVHGRELWRSDGTGPGTLLLADLRAGDGDSDFGHWYVSAVAFGDALVFLAYDGQHGISLLRSDGTPGDVHPLTDFGGGSRWPAALAVGAGAVWASLHDDGVNLHALWRSDGTAAGTMEVPIGPEISQLVPSGDGMFGLAVANGGDSIWRLDDLATGPVEVGELEFGLDQLLDADGVLVGLAGRGAPWRLGAGFIDGGPDADQLAVFGRRLLLVGPYYYDALDLWATDGTRTGAFRLQTLPAIEQRRYSNAHLPLELAAAGGYVFFGAEAGDVGEELWALPLDALPELCVDNCPDLPTPVPTPTPPPTPTPTCGGDCTTLLVGRVTAAPGERVAVPVTLASRGEPIAGVLLDLAFPPQARVAATARGGADCRVDPAIGKDASAFVFQPVGCDPARTCTAVRALILSLLDADPIADGATLFTCQIAVDARARAGEYRLAVPRSEVSSPLGSPVPFGTREGSVTVVHTGTRASTASTSGCQIDPFADGHASGWVGLAFLLAWRRRQQSNARS